MPLFPPVTDTLRWDDLVRQGRAQLPLVASEWTDQNTSDPGIAALELLSWLVEADAYRAAAVTDRERRRLLALTGWVAGPARAARCLVAVGGPPGTVVPAGLAGSAQRDATTIPLVLDEDVVASGCELVALAAAGPEADGAGYRTDCFDLLRSRTARRPLQPFGTDPAPGCSLVIGLRGGGAGTPAVGAGPLDLWLDAGDGLWLPESAAGGTHHSVRTAWDTWDGTTWVPLPDTSVEDRTAAATRSGRVRLVLPSVPATTLGDQAVGLLAGTTAAWLRLRLVGGRHEVAPVLGGLWLDAGPATAAAPFSSSLELPAGAITSGVPIPASPLPRAVVRLVTAADGTVLAAHLEPPSAVPGPDDLPAVDVLVWQQPTAVAPGRLHADLAVLGVAAGVPLESFRLPAAWCGAAPRLWAVDRSGTGLPVRVVDDLVLLRATELGACLDPDGITVHFGDGRLGRTLPAGATMLAAGTWTVTAGVGDLRPPLPVEVPVDDRTQALLGGAAGAVALMPVAAITAGSPAEDTTEVAARAERALWVHDRLAGAAGGAGGSLDGLGLAAIRTLDVPERAVTGPDVERIALATPGTALRRARALVGVDPRLPGLRASGCLTVVVVPGLPVARPEPTAAVLARVRSHLEETRTLGTRVFVVAPQYAVISVTAELILLDGAQSPATLAAARAALAGFLHPVTGGPSGQGWAFGRAVRRSEILQLLDLVPGVDDVGSLTLAREPGSADCGDVALCPTELALAGTLSLTATPPTSGGAR